MSEHAAPRGRARSEHLAGRTSPRGAAPHSASVVSSPSDSAAGGNAAGAPTARAPGGEGEPHSPYRDARLGSTDKKLKAGATAEGSAPGALGSPGERTPRVQVMDPGLWGPAWKGCRGDPFSPWPGSAVQKRGAGDAGETRCPRRVQRGAGPEPRTAVSRVPGPPLEAPAGGRRLGPGSPAWVTPVFQAPVPVPGPLWRPRAP